MLPIFSILLLCILGYQVEAREVIYNFNIKYFTGAPDGVQKQILGVNGQFPGPTIRATIGDILTVRVTNSIQTGEGTTIHWHGLEQYLTPFEDGPEGVTQCPIEQGATQTYQFKLNQAGTYWWHSHHSYQYTEGCWGIIIIDNKPEVHKNKYDEELVISLNDWYHKPGKELARWFLSSASKGFPPIPNSAMINGVGRYDCSFAHQQNQICSTSSQRYPVFEVVRGRRYRIRVINTAAHAEFRFSIDNHKLTTIEVDGVDTVKVSPVDQAILASAMRYSFVVPMNAGGTNFWIRANVTAPFDFPNNINPFPQAFQKNVLGILRYKDEGSGVVLIPNQAASRPSIDDGDEITMGFRPMTIPPPLEDDDDEIIVGGGRPATHDLININSQKRTMDMMPAPTIEISNTAQFNQIINYEFLNSPNLPTTTELPRPVVLNPNNCQPVDRREAPTHFNQTFSLTVEFKTFRNGEVRAGFNHKIYTVGNKPVIYQVINREHVPSTAHAINTKVGRGVVVQLVINTKDGRGHPFHLHGHTFWVVGTGEPNDGDYDPIRHASKLRLNGVRRDTTSVPPKSWAVLRYYADNPGVWLIHCHINWHLQAGLGAVFVEGGPAIVSSTLGTRVPAEGVEVCRKAGVTVP